MLLIPTLTFLCFAIVISDKPPPKSAQSQGGGVFRVPSDHTSYEPLAYVITHMYGDKGWTNDGIPRQKLNADSEWISTGKYVTCREYYAYRMHTQDPIGCNDIVEDTLTYGGLLKHQFDCDNYVKVEENRLL